MTVLNLTTSVNNMKKEIPLSDEETKREEKCYVTKFESVLIAMILTSILLYATHVIISHYSSKIPDYCYLKVEPGLCRGYFQAWYYDPAEGTCKAFIYGGCGGNDNQFDSEEECLVNCTRKPISLGFVSRSNVS